MTAYTGYGNLAHHMHKMSLEQAPSCPRCDNEDEDTKHFVAQCPAFVQERMATLGGSLLNREDWIHYPPERLSKYIQRTGRLSELVDLSATSRLNDTNSQDDD